MVPTLGRTSSVTSPQRVAFLSGENEPSASYSDICITGRVYEYP